MLTESGRRLYTLGLAGGPEDTCVVVDDEHLVPVAVYQPNLRIG